MFPAGPNNGWNRVCSQICGPSWTAVFGVCESVLMFTMEETPERSPSVIDRYYTRWYKTGEASSVIWDVLSIIFISFYPCAS